MKLDAKTVAGLALPVGKTDYIIWDDDPRGFGFRLRAGAGGKVLRSWIVQYKRDGRSRRMLLGPAEVLGIEAARQQAKKAIGAVYQGKDPQGEKAEQRDRNRLSLRSQVAAFLDAKKPEIAERSLIEMTRYLTDSKYFGPLHSKPLHSIKLRDVAERITRIEHESGAATAIRARGTLSSFFTWAMRRGLCESNPVIGAATPAAKSRERVLTDPELVAIWRACRDDDHGRLVRLLILTGCRRSEIGEAMWGEFNFDRGTFTIPAIRPTGRKGTKNGRPHVLPLGMMMREIVEACPRMVGRDQLFGMRSYGFTRWNESKIALDQRSNVNDWTLHDIRRTVATRMNDIGAQPHIVEQILNHQSGHRRGVAGVYNKSVYTNEVRNALALWEDHIRALIEGGERRVLNFPAVS